MATKTEQTTAFLRLLYGEGASGHIAIWTPDRYTRWFQASEQPRVADVAANLARIKDVYFGLGLQSTALGMHQRGTANDVSAIPGVWIEIDVLDPTHKAKNLPPTMEDAIRLVEIFPLGPSILVHSAHGLHAYWLFRELWVFGEGERAQAQALVRRFQKTIRGYANLKHWHIDTTSDLARVLRLPGTLNHKDNPPQPVQLLYADDSRRYDPGDFEPYLVDDDPPPSADEWQSEDGEIYLANPEPIIEGCAWLRHCRDDAAQLEEPEWYAMLSILGRCVNGENIAHEWSEPYAGYSPEETFTKLQHAIEAAKPRTCKDIRAKFNDIYCQSCHQWGKIGSPIALGDPPRVGVKFDPNSTPEEWLPPTPFFQPNVPSFPLEVLPEWLRAYVEAEATFTQTPPDMGGMLSLGAIGAAVQKKVAIEPRDGWREPVNIYTVAILPPANRKTAVLASVTKPIEEYERDESIRMGKDITEAKARLKIAEQRLSQSHSAAAKATGEQAEQAARETIQLALDAASIKVPANPRLLADDCTPEKLASLLAEHGGCMSVFSAEGDIFDLMAGRYGNGANFAVFQKGHAGETLRVDRIHRAPEYIPDPALTLALAVQPDVIRGLIAQPSFRGRGLLGRFLYVWPESLLGRRAITPTPLPPSVYLEYCVQMRNLLKIKPDIDDLGNVQPHVLKLNAEGQHTINEFMAWVEPQLGEMGQLHCIEDWAGKLVGAVIRLAALLHMADHSRDPIPWRTLVSGRTVARAITLGRYLIAHALTAFNEMGADEDAERARFILRWIERAGTTAFSKRDIYQGTKGTFKRIEALETPLRLLIDHGYIRRRPEEARTGKAGRPPSPMFDVNPYFVPTNTI